MAFVWYLGYGSNLHEQRFLCYIIGGTPSLGKRPNRGCHDGTLPAQSKPTRIHHRLYFALPDRISETANWGRGGVAFIDPSQDSSCTTFCRMWRITEGQYREVKDQEGLWYSREMSLGEEEGIPIRTLTHDFVLTENILCPSEAYIKTIVLGLRETYLFGDKEICDYLLGIEGIVGNIDRAELLHILARLSSHPTS